MAERYPNALPVRERRAKMIHAAESLRLLLDETDENDKLSVGVEVCVLALAEFDARCAATPDTTMAFWTLEQELMPVVYDIAQKELASSGSDVIDDNPAPETIDGRATDGSCDLPCVSSARLPLLSAVLRASDALLTVLNDQHVTADVVCNAVLVVARHFLAYSAGGDGLSNGNWRSLAFSIQEFNAGYDLLDNDGDNGFDPDDFGSGPDEGPDNEPTGPSRPTHGSELQVSMRRASRPARHRRRRVPV